MEESQNNYTIGEAAKKLGVIVPLLRMLDKSELVLTARTDHGKRVYTDCHIDYIRALLQLAKKKNFTMDDINECIGAVRCWEVVDCALEIRLKCANYNDSSKPCWVDSDCSEDEKKDKCRECKVYLNISESLFAELDKE